MAEETAQVRRELDLSPAIVWDALVDPVLVEGWLHPVERLLEGTQVIGIEEPLLLEVDSPEFGRLAFELAPLAGGEHDARTEITVTVDPGDPPRLIPALIAEWETRLDQLEALLRGHPVDWDHWSRDHQADYDAYLTASLAAHRGR